MPLYIGMVVGPTLTDATILDEEGNRLEVHLFATRTEKLIERFKRLRGRLHVCLEASEHSAWVRDTLRPHVEEVIVTAPFNRQGPVIGTRDSWSLAEWIRLGLSVTRQARAATVE
jgi:hypothetical protein